MEIKLSLILVMTYSKYVLVLLRESALVLCSFCYIGYVFADDNQICVTSEPNVANALTTINKKISYVFL